MLEAARTIAVNRNVIRHSDRELVEQVWEHRRQRAHQLLTDDLDVIQVVS